MRRLGVLAVVSALVAGCAGGSGGPSASPTSTPVPAPTEPAELTIYGAASLKGLLDAAKAGYEATHDGVTVVISTDSSAALAIKIEQGAPADVFLSADMENAEKLNEKGLTTGPAIAFAGNELALIVPLDNPAGIDTPADLAREGVAIIAAGDEVPISGYASRLVTNLAALPRYPKAFADRYAANVLSTEESVKAIVAKVELGEGDAGIVYATDAAASDKVATVEVPEGANVRATYAAVIVRTSRYQGEAQAFLDWLTGPDGLAILQGLGFLPPPE